MKSYFGSAIVKAIQTFVLCVSFTALAFAQIAGLSDTGQPPATALGGTEVLVPSAPSTSGTPHLDGNWKVGLTINGQLASDNATYGLYLESPAGSPANCAAVAGQNFPVNPASGYPQFQQWWPFSFTNSRPIAAGADAYLYVVMQNGAVIYGGSSTGLRVEFFSSSSFK